MRKTFANALYKEMGKKPNIILLTGDLGYGIWDKIRLDYPNQFINVGSSEQLMLGIATGLALSGKIPFVYSITPFLLYRPFEFIRNYLDYECIPVKLVGGGRDKDYKSLGFTHWAEEDKKVMGIFKNIEVFYPDSLEDIHKFLDMMLSNNTPSYINLRK